MPGVVTATREEARGCVDDICDLRKNPPFPVLNFNDSGRRDSSRKPVVVSYGRLSPGGRAGPYLARGSPLDVHQEFNLDSDCPERFPAPLIAPTAREVANLRIETSNVLKIYQTMNLGFSFDHFVYLVHDPFDVQPEVSEEFGGLT